MEYEETWSDDRDHLSNKSINRIVWGGRGGGERYSCHVATTNVDMCYLWWTSCNRDESVLNRFEID